jgi:hypothetical protein
MSALEKLTEGIVSRDLGQEGAALLNKWEKTGLLEGLDNDVTKNNMARLLENQAKQLLKEASTMEAGNVEGFSAVAFPIVRRVFGDLIANELVSVQPMSLPSGLIFFLDFTVEGDTARLGYTGGESLYGGNKVGSQITGGIDLGGTYPTTGAEEGAYSLNNGYASPTASITVATTVIASGNYGGGDVASTLGTGDDSGVTAAELDKLLRYDPDIPSGSNFAICSVPVATLSDGGVNMDNLVALTPTVSNAVILRRLTRIDPDDTNRVLIVAVPTTSKTNRTTAQLSSSLDAITAIAAPIKDGFTAGGATGAVVGTTTWQLENETSIPEVNISVDSLAVTAMTKKLKAKWSPELGQDLNAYHNLDAEVELTSILSEQIALEIDQEILNDLIQGAKATVRYWSRKAGKFVNRLTGVEVGTDGTPDFTGTVSEWYETLLETINDVSAEIHRKTVRGGANFLVCSPEVANILEFTAGFRANVNVDANGTAGAMNVGSISKKLDVYVDPYFPRNVVLVGRRGNSFLESGYVYAPYVPLQVTPTIFGVEDFVPRKGVMTRYAKQMVRADMYGLVICQDLV